MNPNPMITAFGELLLRIQSNASSLIYAPATLFPGGSEANVVYALSQYGIPSRYISAAPDQALTQEILSLFKEQKIDTSAFILDGDRLGTYILLGANGLSSGEVIYDRKYSSFSQIKPNSIDWDKVLKGSTWFHWSALTPALNPTMPIVMEEALQAAKRLGIYISVDLNYRSKLWQYGKQPLDIMPQLVSYCDVIMGNIWAANKMLGTKISEDLHRDTPKEDYFDLANSIASTIFEQYPNCQHIANTFRFMDHAQHNLLYATYHTPSHNWITDTLETFNLIDRIGSGDAFMAGLIYALNTDKTGQQVIDTALQFGFDKLFIPGDFLKINK